MAQETVTFLSSSFFLAALGAFLLGIAKSGVKGIAVFIVVLFVFAFGARASTGILMPLLIGGDIFAIIYYKKYAHWRHVFQLIPWMFLGVILGTYGGSLLDENTFKTGMASLIFITTLLLFYWERRPAKQLPEHWSFAGLLGILAGFTTMIGNLAGAVTNIYFLAMRLPKNVFIATAAYVFFIVNVFKIPFHIWAWETISVTSFKVSLQFFPFLALGLFFGVHLVKKINDTNYRKLILLLTAIGSVALFFR
ncbi:MAG: sulfite exporter TauE/SafE family protein [Flavobacteriaceae bacterium]